MPRIFISYRREDSIAYAGRIYDRLKPHFGATNVFMDIDTLEPGVDFVEVLQRTVASCDVLLAVVGVQWLAIKDEEGRTRLSNPEDFVALEIGTALDRQDIRVVPILVGGARMPRSVELPERLSGLTKRHALILPDMGFHEALGKLIQSIERAEQERLAREKAEAAENADRKKQEQASRTPGRLVGWIGRGKGDTSPSRLAAYVFGGLVLAAVGLFIARNNWNPGPIEPDHPKQIADVAGKKTGNVPRRSQQPVSRPAYRQGLLRRPGKTD